MSCPYPRSSTTSDGHAGQHSDAPEECRNSGSRGTVCVNCARTGLWGGRVGNHRLYPEADANSLRSCLAPAAGAAHRGRSASRNVHRHDTIRMSRVIPCIPVLIGAEERGEFSVPQRQDETIIARRVGCTEVDRCERGNHAGGKWPPRRQRRAVCSGHGVVLHLEDRIVRESEASTYRYKYPYVDATT